MPQLRLPSREKPLRLRFLSYRSLALNTLAFALCFLRKPLSVCPLIQAGERAVKLLMTGKQLVIDRAILLVGSNVALPFGRISFAAAKDSNSPKADEARLPPHKPRPRCADFPPR
ncbi:MAG: hypothetical protein R2912_10610 [Eubacteriales bacterium]